MTTSSSGPAAAVPVAAIAGGVVGGVLLSLILVILVLILALLVFRQRMKTKSFNIQGTTLLELNILMQFEYLIASFRGSDQFLFSLLHMLVGNQGIDPYLHADDISTHVD